MRGTERKRKTETEAGTETETETETARDYSVCSVREWLPLLHRHCPGTAGTALSPSVWVYLREAIRWSVALSRAKVDAVVPRT